jgi:glycosyltransferase involved in cell wall biosynthesis
MSAPDPRCPDVSIVLCTHNRAARLQDALASLFALHTDGGFAFEIVVVDNASTDATPQVVQAAALSPDRPAACRVVSVFESKKGIATARNRGVATASGSWIAFFDDDQEADPRWLIELLAAARRKRARCVGGKVELKLPDGCRRSLSSVCRMLLGGTVAADELRPYNHRFTPGTGNLLVHQSVFDEIGRFDEDYSQRGEDTDLFLRMLAAEIEAWYTPRAVVQHIIPPERLQDDWFLRTAWRTADGMARDERQAWGPVWYPLVWLARLGQTAALLLPRWAAARITGNAEAALGARCRLAIARRHLWEGLQLFVPSGRIRGVLAGRPVRPTGTLEPAQLSRR